jgi:uncharacterized protein
MKIDVSGIEKNSGAFLDFDINEKLPSLNNIRDGYRFTEAIRFKGRIVNNKGILRLKGNLKAHYMTVCSRCVKPLDREINIDIAEEIVNLDKAKDTDKENIYTFSGGYLYVDRIIQDNTILSLPMREICSPECKGICPKCGKDLNEETCRCKEDNIDMRLEALKYYFKS